MTTANDTNRHIANYHRRMATSRAIDQLDRRDAIKRVIVDKGISTEVDDAGRVIAATLPSNSNPNEALYALVRSVRVGWMHADPRCPAFTAGRMCWHIRTLTELCEEIDRNDHR